MLELSLPETGQAHGGDLNQWDGKTKMHYKDEENVGIEVHKIGKTSEINHFEKRHPPFVNPSSNGAVSSRV